jgi:uncharacterized protein (TIGR03435 family)
MNDIELLQEFAQRGSEGAFRTLVERHIDFVYTVALRQIGNTHTADEITQTVFIDLARKAAAISPKTILSGWLFRAARFAGAKNLRSELRRQSREREAAQMAMTADDNNMESSREQMEPILNEALDELSEKDRDALFLRFFEKKALKEVGERLGLNEEAAKKRVARAVEKLRLIFQRHGVVMPSAVLLAALSAQTTHAAPAGLAATIATTATLKGTTVVASTLTLGKGILNIMAISKLKIAAAATAALLLVGGTTTFVLQHRAQTATRTSATAESTDDALALEILNRGDSRSLDDAPPLVFLRVHNGPAENPWRITANGKLMGKAAPLRELLTMAYDTSENRLRMPVSAPWQDERFDYVVSLPSEQKEGLQQAIREKLGLTAQPERRLEDVYVLSARTGDFPGLQSTVLRGGGTSMNNNDGQLTCNNATINALVRTIEQLIRRPIIDETGLRDHYDVSLTWGEPGQKQPGPEALKKALAEQLGLELTPDKRDSDILLVRTLNTP